MNNIPFIFSNEKRFWISRHITFWTLAIFGQGLLALGIRPLFNITISHNMLAEFMLLPLLYLPGQLLLVYSLLYFILPRYVMRTKYRAAFIWLVVLTVVSAILSGLSYAVLDESFRSVFMNPTNLGINGLNDGAHKHDLIKRDWSRFPFEFVFGLRAVINVGGFASAIKLMKYWYEKEYRNTILQKEKLNAELQSLKSQIHPHFLFNTLNNIFSITEKTSPLASDIILRLSSLLRYILYDCNRPSVMLSQEFKLIEDYIALEKLRYNNLDVQLQLPQNAHAYQIAPLLMLPLVENCFKHGTSQVLEQPWINIRAELSDYSLTIKLINGKAIHETDGPVESKGIGLVNLKKRLDLLYPRSHQFSITKEEGVFVVILKVSLMQQIT